MFRDEPRQVGKSRGIEGNRDNLDLSRLIQTYPDLSRLFPLLISATILKNPDCTDYPGTLKVGINREIGKNRDNLDFPRLLELSRLVSTPLD